MTCAACGRPEVAAAEHPDEEMAERYGPHGLDLCTGCNLPADACTCEPLA